MAPLIHFAKSAAGVLPDDSSRSLSSTVLARGLYDLTSRILAPRLAEDVSTVPEGYGRTQNGPDAGTVVGIVLGSVAGFVLLLWLIYWCVNMGAPPAVLETASIGGGSTSVVSRHSAPRPHRHRRSHQSRSSQARPPHETVEIRREHAVPIVVPPPRAPEPDEIVVEEEHHHHRPRSRTISRPHPPPPREPAEDDEIMVIEEHTPPRRASRSHRRRSSGSYRDIDPYRYAGGDAPPRSISRRRSSPRR
ncbi:hypothetical protein F5B20DRAFT_408736 [Whalleya microplaca]|nr:hypothetical protein F5B20DRAFT_408736 [Whalleya microplaca]